MTAKWNAVILVVISSFVTVRSQVSSLRDICKGLGTANISGADCNTYVACDGNGGTLKTCPAGMNWNPYGKTCDKSGCSSPRGYWKQTMKTGGLIGVHCTLVPNTDLVVIWHRGVNWKRFKPEPGMGQPGNASTEMLSAVLDPRNDRYKGYDVGPPFCSGHVPLPDGSILNCGGEAAGALNRTNDPEDGINKCRIFKCRRNSPDSCSWKTIGDIGSSRWYPGMILFPAYTDKGPFAIVTGGSNISANPNGTDFVNTTIDWVWPFAKEGKKFATTPATKFTLAMREMNLYPLLWLMPFRNKGKYVMFEWTVNHGDLVTVSDPAKNRQPISLYKKVPPIKPDVAITYPAGGCAALHALEPPYKSAKVTIFGGHTGRYTRFQAMRKIDGSKAGTKSSWTIDLAASNPTWEEEPMPDNAIMRACFALPNGKIQLIHGARKGRMASTPFGNGCGKDPLNNGWIYDPKATKGQRFSVDPSMQATFRGYHACGLLMPDGSIFSAGGDSAPLYGNTTECFGSVQLNYNVDGYLPPNIFKAILTNQRPEIKTSPSTMGYGKTYTISYSGTVTECSLMTPAANTHSVEQSGRVVFLETISNDKAKKVMSVRTPLDQVVILPGWQLLFCVNNRDAYSKGRWVLLQ